MILSVLLWNTGGIKSLLEILLQEAKYDILCIQEPWINNQTKGTYCPQRSKYNLVHTPGGRTAIYVSNVGDKAFCLELVLYCPSA